MWRFLWFSLSAGIISRFGEIAATPAIKPQSQRGIIFPTVEQYEHCYVDAQQTVSGVCKRLSECPSAAHRWQYQQIRPQTCYFNKFDHIVCCERGDTDGDDEGPNDKGDLQLYTPKPIVARRSEVECLDKSGNDFHTAIAHGEPTVYKEYPYMAALGWKSNFDDTIIYHCGGALVSDKFVLTAAHCVDRGGEQPSVVRTGGVNLTDAGTMDINIKQIRVHPGYRATSTYNDIALIELEQSALDKPACIWSEAQVEHSNVTAIGYGHTRFAGASSAQLLKASLQIVPNGQCKVFYTPDGQSLADGIVDSQICAKDPAQLRDTCQGDSGGPIIMRVLRDSFVNYVVGITSFGQGCANAPPSIYTRTSHYIDWIESIVWPAKSRRAAAK